MVEISISRHIRLRLIPLLLGRCCDRRTTQSTPPVIRTAAPPSRYTRKTYLENLSRAVPLSKPRSTIPAAVSAAAGRTLTAMKVSRADHAALFLASSKVYLTLYSPAGCTMPNPRHDNTWFMRSVTTATKQR
jgi:hypothetical protein